MVVLMNHFPAELFAAQKSFPSDMQYDDLVSSCSPFFYCLKLILSISEYQPQLEYSNAPLACGGIGFEDEFEAGEGGAPVQVGGGVRLPQRYKLIGNIGAPVSPTPPSFGTFRQVIILFITIFTSILITQS